MINSQLKTASGSEAAFPWTVGMTAYKAEKHPIVRRLLCTKILFKVQRKLTVGL